MNETLIIAIAQILECDPSDISMSTEFRSLPNWDSLALLSVAAMIESDFGVLIPDSEFRNMKTISDILDFIGKHAG